MISNLSSQEKCIYNSKLQSDCSVCVCVFDTHRRLIVENNLRLKRHLGVGARGRNIAVFFKVKTTASTYHRIVYPSPHTPHITVPAFLLSSSFPALCVCSGCSVFNLNAQHETTATMIASQTPSSPPPPSFGIESPFCLLHCPCYGRGADDTNKSPKTK